MKTAVIIALKTIPLNINGILWVAILFIAGALLYNGLNPKPRKQDQKENQLDAEAKDKFFDDDLR